MSKLRQLEVADREPAPGVSLSRYLEQLIERDPLDEHGRPVWAAEAGLLRGKRTDLPLAGMKSSMA